jgi:Tol biopolymer transport system component
VFELDHPNGTTCSIEIMNADGSHVTDLTGARPGCEYTPSFTPNGRRIVFAAQGCEACIEAIRSIDLHGRERRLVVQPHGLDFERPQVSPDGRTVLFLAEQDLGSVDGIDANVKALFTVRINGTHLRRVVPFDLDVCACGGDWSPDGRSIEFGDNAGYGAPQVRPNNIATIRPDGSGFRLVTDFQRPDVYAANGSYSPDGRWILFRTSRAGHNSLWKIHPDGTRRTLVAHFQFSPGTRDWGSRPG